MPRAVIRPNIVTPDAVKPLMSDIVLPAKSLSLLIRMSVR